MNNERFTFSDFIDGVLTVICYILALPFTIILFTIGTILYILSFPYLAVECIIEACQEKKTKDKKEIIDAVSREDSDVM